MHPSFSFCCTYACPRVHTHAVLSEDPYCFEIKVSVEDSEEETHKGRLLDHSCPSGCNMSVHCTILSPLRAPSLHSPPPADVAVQFTLPPTYPDVPPEVTVTAASGLGEEEQRELERVIGEQVREGVMEERRKGVGRKRWKR